MANKINKVSAGTIQAMRQKSALGLPDRPSESGLTPLQIKKALADFVTGASYSALAEVDRLADELNTIFNKLFVGVYEELPVDLTGFENGDRIILTDGSIYEFDGSLNVFIRKNDEFESLLTAHLNDKTNPHNVTKVQINLGNVDDKSSATIRSEITVDNIPTLPQSKIANLESNLSALNINKVDKTDLTHYAKTADLPTAYAPTDAEKNVQSDWNQTVDTEDDYIKNKPSIPSKTSDLTNDKFFATETYVNNKVSAVYKPQGSVSFSSLVADLLVPANSGFVYNITDAFTTNENFVEGPGKSHSAGTNVVIIEQSGNYKFDVLSGTVDLTPYELSSNKVTEWSASPTDDQYPSEQLVKGSLDELDNKIEGVSDLSPYHFERTFVGDDLLQNDFDNLIVGYEDLKDGYAFNETKLRGSYFVCSAESAFWFNTIYHWSPAAGGGKTSPITYTWAAPYDLSGLTDPINMKPGDIISILDFSYDAVNNKISTIIKVEKNLNDYYTKIEIDTMFDNLLGGSY